MSILSLVSMQGIAWSITGPTIPDLCHRMDVTTEQIGMALSIASFAWLSGSFAFSLLIDRFKHLYQVCLFNENKLFLVISVAYLLPAKYMYMYNK